MLDLIESDDSEGWAGNVSVCNGRLGKDGLRGNSAQGGELPPSHRQVPVASGSHPRAGVACCQASTGGSLNRLIPQRLCLGGGGVVASVDAFPGICQKHLSTVHPPRANNTPFPSSTFNTPSQGSNINNTKRDSRASSHYVPFSLIWVPQFLVSLFNQDLNPR